MKRSLVFAIVINALLAGPLHAQTINQSFVQLINEQGFTIISTGYTWLGRTVIHATNGTYEREIVLARGSDEILQDNWQLIKLQSTINSALPNSGLSTDKGPTPKGPTPSGPAPNGPAPNGPAPSGPGPGQ